jgi:hypothetical protein
LPPVPHGHRLSCRVNDHKGGYWLAIDDRGYEYVLGACVETAGDVQRVSVRTADGAKREWAGSNGQWQRLDSAGAADAYRQQHAAARSLSAWMLPTGLPPVESAGVTAAKRIAAALVDGRAGAGAWLHGPPGCGKTLAAHWIALHCTQHRMQVCHRSTADLARVMRASYGGDPEGMATWHRLQAFAEAADLLVLDDVGAEGKGDDLRAEILRIVDCRQSAGLPILATSNYSTDTISQPTPAGCGMDPRLASRFGRLRPVLMGTTDFRRVR